MRRLTGVEAEALEARRIDAAREWAQRWRSVVVLKGAPTVTGIARGHATVNPTGNPGMATAGMGDVLTGAIAALIAQGLAPYDAARLGVYAHGMAGDLAAGERGQYGLAAGDAIESLPLALLALARLRAGVVDAPAPANGRAASGHPRADPDPSCPTQRGKSGSTSAPQVLHHATGGPLWLIDGKRPNGRRTRALCGRVRRAVLRFIRTRTFMRRHPPCENRPQYSR